MTTMLKVYGTTNYLDYLDLTEDDDNFTFDMSCARVYEVLSIKSPKEADHLYASDRFWEKKWQLEFRQRCRERIFCYLEEACSGEAVKQLRKLGVRMMESMREYMFRRFGAGQPEVLHEALPPRNAGPESCSVPT